MIAQILFFYFLGIAFVYSDPIPCSTCTENHAVQCCSQHGRCCREVRENSGACPQFPTGLCVYRCSDDAQCNQSEKCCHRNGKFPHVCVVGSACPKSLSKSTILKSCGDNADCRQPDETCCLDPRLPGCCLGKIVTNQATVTVTTTTTTRKKINFTDEWVVNQLDES